jgi:hypothetical protein
MKIHIREERPATRAERREQTRQASLLPLVAPTQGAQQQVAGTKPQTQGKP